MAVFTLDIFENLIFQERSKKNLHTANVSERIQLVQALRSNIKQFNIHEVIRLTEQARRAGGIYNLAITETITFTETKHPKVKVYDAADVLTLVEFASHLSNIDRIIITEVLTYLLVKTIKETLSLTETLTFKANRNLPVTEILTLTEGVVGLLIQNAIGANYSDIVQPCTVPRATQLVIQTPSGVINGTNKIFTLSLTPRSGSLNLFVNNVQRFDYSLVSTTITFVTAPPVNSHIVAYYFQS